MELSSHGYAWQLHRLLPFLAILARNDQNTRVFDRFRTNTYADISLKLRVPVQVPVFHQPEGVYTVLTNNAHGLIIQHNLCTRDCHYKDVLQSIRFLKYEAAITVG